MENKKRKYYISEKRDSGFVKIHVLNLKGSHTICGIEIGSLIGAKPLSNSKKMNCPYCGNELLYYSKFLKHLDVEV